MESDCFESLETRLRTMIERSNPLSAVTPSQASNLGDPLFALTRITGASNLEE